MPTLDEYISNKSSYPDETVIKLIDGETTLGDLRKGYMRDSDYRHKTMDVATRRRALEQERQEWESARVDAEAKLTELAKSLIDRNPGYNRQDVDDELDADPRAKKLQDKISNLESKLDTVGKQFQQTMARQSQYERTYIADQHQKVVTGLKQRDPDLDVEGLVNFARSRYIPRLDDAYIVYRNEKLVTDASNKAREEGRKEGLRKAKEELIQPVLGTRRIVSPLGDDKSPKTFDEARDAALKDPEILKIMTGEGA